MRKRRSTAEILLKRSPARSPRKSQAVPVTVETPKLWPAGATSAQASQWWADLAKSKGSSVSKRVAGQSAALDAARRCPVNLGQRRTSFVHFRQSATTRPVGETHPENTHMGRRL